MKTVGSLTATSALVAEVLCVARRCGSATAGHSAPRVVIVPDHPQRTIALRAEQLASINRLDARAALRRLPAVLGVAAKAAVFARPAGQLRALRTLRDEGQRQSTSPDFGSSIFFPVT